MRSSDLFICGEALVSWPPLWPPQVQVNRALCLEPAAVVNRCLLLLPLAASAGNFMCNGREEKRNGAAGIRNVPGPLAKKCTS